MVILLIVTVLSVGVLCVLYIYFVRAVPIPSINQTALVSVGYQKTDFAARNYPTTDWNDWTILQDAGPTEEKILTIWTLHSIGVARFLLWLFYTIALACIVGIASLMVYQHAADSPPEAA